VHRDVSPDNLFVTYDGDMKLLDFGIARAARRLAQTNLGQVKGKLRYMAPEYALGQDFDESLDVFALGATLYEAAVGVPAFEGDEQAVMQRLVLGKVKDPREIRPDFPEPLWNVLTQLLAPRAEERLGPASAVARALDEFAGLSPAQGRMLLKLTLERLFREEIAAEARDLTELRALSRSPEDRTEHGHAVNREAARPSGGAFKAVLIAGAAASAAIALLAMRHPSKPVADPAPSVQQVVQAAPSAPLPSALAAEPSPSVDIAVVVQPPGIAELAIEIDGARVSAEDPHRAVLRGQGLVAVRVSAPGYAPVQTEVHADRDRSLVLGLTPVHAPSHAASARPNPSPGPEQRAAPAAPPGGVIKRYPF